MDTGRRDHAHLWYLPDGTGLHAPPGDVTVDDATGRLCCHLCGRWFAALGAHVRVHGYTAEEYRTAMGLCTRQPLVSAPLSDRIARRQSAAYDRDPAMRERLAAVAAMRRSGELTRRARTALRREDPPQRKALRRAALRTGRTTMAMRREKERAQRLAELGFATLDEFLRAAYADGASLDRLAQVTGLGRQRLRNALTAAGIEIRGRGQTTTEGRRSRAVTAERRAAERVGTNDLAGWLRDRHREGWSLSRLAAAVGHSSHWVRWRLDADQAS